MENTKQKYIYILDGEIPLGTSVNCSRNYSHYLWNYGLPENLQYRKDPETRENHAFKLTNGYLLPTYQDASALEIACSLMEYMTWLYRKTLCKVYQGEK